MSQWHAHLGLTGDGNTYNVVYHIPIPSALNRSGVNYRVALINSGIGGKTILPDGDGSLGTITSAEKTLLLAGEIYELVEPFATNPSQDLAALTALVNARYAELANVSNPFIKALQARLEYFGGKSAS